MNEYSTTGMRGRKRLKTALLQLLRAMTVALYCVLIAVGALVYPTAAVIAGPAAALGGAAFADSLRRRVDAEFPEIYHPTLAGALAGGAPAALSGSSVLEAWGGLAVALLLLAAAVLFGQWIGSAAPVPPRTVEGHHLSARDEQSLRQVLTAMPTDVLLDEWHVTQRRLASGAEGTLWEVQLRDLLIDELSTRDPSGTARWLSGGIVEAPGRHIRPDSEFGRDMS